MQDVAGIGLGEGWKNRGELWGWTLQRTGDDNRGRLGGLRTTAAGHTRRRATPIVFSRVGKGQTWFADDQSGDTGGTERQESDDKGECQTAHTAILAFSSRSQRDSNSHAQLRFTI
jgi:hypothetical protein